MGFYMMRSLSLSLPRVAQTNMPGMKRDCGGAAAVLGAFYTAVKLVSFLLLSYCK